jgi:hypothetical protein
MKYENINEEYENWRGSWQDSKLMAKLNEKQREKDFREGYMRGFEIATKIAEKKNLDMILKSIDTGLLNEMVAYAEKDKTEVKK